MSRTITILPQQNSNVQFVQTAILFHPERQTNGEIARIRGRFARLSTSIHGSPTHNRVARAEN
jgi:hypothetical protein